MCRLMCSRFSTTRARARISEQRRALSRERQARTDGRHVRVELIQDSDRILTQKPPDPSSVVSEPPMPWPRATTTPARARRSRGTTASRRCTARASRCRRAPSGTRARTASSSRARARERHRSSSSCSTVASPGASTWSRRARATKTKRTCSPDRTDAALGTLGFPTTPAAATATRTAGATRRAPAATAILLANDTWGGRFDWLLHGDDDTMLYLEATARARAHAARDAAATGAHRLPRTPPSESPARRAPERARPRVGRRARTRPTRRSKRAPSTSRAATRGICDRDDGDGDGGRDGQPRRRRTPLGRARRARARARARCGPDAGREHFCCPVSPARRAPRCGFPYALDPARGTPPYPFVRAWVFGGDGYVLSAGLLRAVGRARWAECDACSCAATRTSA